MAATSEQSIDERNVITVISEGQLEATAASGATYEYIPLNTENSNNGTNQARDALQAALESAEVDKMVSSFMDKSMKEVVIVPAVEKT